MLAAICNHDEDRPCPICRNLRLVALRLVTPEGICPPRVIDCPHCTDGAPLAAAIEGGAPHDHH